MEDRRFHVGNSFEHWRAAGRRWHGTMGVPGNRRKIYRSIEELQINLNDWLHHYNHDRTVRARNVAGKALCKL